MWVTPPPGTNAYPVSEGKTKLMQYPSSIFLYHCNTESLVVSSLPFFFFFLLKLYFYSNAFWLHHLSTGTLAFLLSLNATTQLLNAHTGDHWILRYEPKMLLKFNFFQLVEWRCSCSKVLLWIYWLTTHGLKNKNVMRSGKTHHMVKI